MTTAYWCVLFSAYLPILWTAIAKGSTFNGAANHAPRAFLNQLKGWRQRAHWAQLNGFEAFPPFAAAVIIAHLQHESQDRVDTFALAFVGLRILHGIFYVTDLAALRSLVWFSSVACVVAIFVGAQ